MFRCDPLSPRLQEYRLRTDPQNPSTSGSGIADGWLVARGLDPFFDYSTVADPDSEDGLTYGQEYRLERGAAGLWRFDEGAGTALGDSSAEGVNAGTLVGGAMWTSDPDGGGALRFFEGDDYADLGNPPDGRFDFGPTRSFTVAARFQTTGPGRQRLVGKGNLNGAGARGYFLDLDGGKLIAGVGAADGQPSSAALSFRAAAPTCGDGQWHHAVVVFDRDAKLARLYVDGMAQTLDLVSGGTAGSDGASADFGASAALLDATAPADRLSAGAAVAVGGSGAAIVSEQFEGSIDDVALYPRALSPAEVCALAGRLRNTAPAVAITAPLDGAALTEGSTVTLQAEAWKVDGGGITKVEFFADAAKLGEAVQFPYVVAWNPVPAGSYQLTARATDGRGATATSAPIAVQVNADSDHDGLPDWWELQYFGNLGQGAQDSYLGDGISNLTKYRQGLDPTKPIARDAALGLQVFTPLQRY